MNTLFLVIKFHYPRNMWAESDFGVPVPT
jgi:hypothetical protein